MTVRRDKARELFRLLREGPAWKRLVADAAKPVQLDLFGGL